MLNPKTGQSIYTKSLVRSQMYVYKVLVNALPATNKMKLVSVINQSSNSVLDLSDMSKYEYGIICQANAAYVGAILLRPSGENVFVLDHFCVMSHHRRKHYGTSMFECLKADLRPADKFVMHIDGSIPEWQTDLLRRWGWVAGTAEQSNQKVTYELTL